MAVINLSRAVEPPLLFPSPREGPNRVGCVEPHMPAARGDRKPCTHELCPGTMQFDREPLATARNTAHRERGWVCGENPGHFTRASESESPATADLSHATAAAPPHET